MITFQVVGAEILAETYRKEVRAFQLEQRKVMRKAANVVKKDVEAKVAQVFPSDTQAHKRSGSVKLGPLRKKIRTRIFNTNKDVIGFIRPAASAFYGRFQETGLNVVRKGRGKRVGHAFHLPRKPFLEPVAKADVHKVAEIIGDAYKVFYSGGS